MVGVQRKWGGVSRGRALRQEINTASNVRLRAGCGSRKSSWAQIPPFKLPLCSQSRDVMEAVCKVAKTTQYRNTTGASGVSRERSVGALCTTVTMACSQAQPGWGNLCLCMHGWASFLASMPSIIPLPQPFSSLPSITPFSKWTLWMLEWELRCGKKNRARMRWPVSEWTCGHREHTLCTRRAPLTLYRSPYITLDGHLEFFPGTQILFCRTCVCVATESKA